MPGSIYLVDDADGDYNYNTLSSSGMAAINSTLNSSVGADLFGFTVVSANLDDGLGPYGQPLIRLDKVSAFGQSDPRISIFADLQLEQSAGGSWIEPTVGTTVLEVGSGNDRNALEGNFVNAGFRTEVTDAGYNSTSSAGTSFHIVTTDNGTDIPDDRISVDHDGDVTYHTYPNTRDDNVSGTIKLWGTDDDAGNMKSIHLDSLSSLLSTSSTGGDNIYNADGALIGLDADSIRHVDHSTYGTIQHDMDSGPGTELTAIRVFTDYASDDARLHGYSLSTIDGDSMTIQTFDDGFYIEATSYLLIQQGVSNPLILGRSGEDVRFQTNFATDNTLTKVLARNALGDLRQVDISAIGGGYTIATETATDPTTVTFGEILPVDCSAATIEIDLPAGTPSAGDTFYISDSRANAGTNNITIDFINAGDNLHGSSQNYIMNVDASFAEFIYINATVGWIVRD